MVVPPHIAAYTVFCIRHTLHTHTPYSAYTIFSIRHVLHTKRAYPLLRSKPPANPASCTLTFPSGQTTPPFHHCSLHLHPASSTTGLARCLRTGSCTIPLCPQPSDPQLHTLKRQRLLQMQYSQNCRRATHLGLLSQSYLAVVQHRGGSQS